MRRATRWADAAAVLALLALPLRAQTDASLPPETRAEIDRAATEVLARGWRPGRRRGPE